MRPDHSHSQSSLSPIVIHDRRPFYNGFMIGSLVAMLIYGCLFVTVLQRTEPVELNAGLVVIEADSDGRLITAIARAKEINSAAAAYLQSCGPDLASSAWREARGDQERYELLSSFIAFSPKSLSEYMPDDFEIVLWDEIRSVSQVAKVGLLASGSALDY